MTPDLKLCNKYYALLCIIIHYLLKASVWMFLQEMSYWFLLPSEMKRCKSELKKGENKMWWIVRRMVSVILKKKYSVTQQLRWREIEEQVVGATIPYFKCLM